MASSCTLIGSLGLYDGDKVNGKKNLYVFKAAVPFGADDDSGDVTGRLLMYVKSGDAIPEPGIYHVSVTTADPLQMGERMSTIVVTSGRVSRVAKDGTRAFDIDLSQYVHEPSCPVRVRFTFPEDQPRFTKTRVPPAGTAVSVTGTLIDCNDNGRMTVNIRDLAFGDFVNRPAANANTSRSLKTSFDWKGRAVVDGKSAQKRKRIVADDEDEDDLVDEKSGKAGESDIYNDNHGEGLSVGGKLVV